MRSQRKNFLCNKVENFFVFWWWATILLKLFIEHTFLTKDCSLKKCIRFFFLDNFQTAVIEFFLGRSI